MLSEEGTFETFTWNSASLICLDYFICTFELPRNGVVRGGVVVLVGCSSPTKLEHYMLFMQVTLMRVCPIHVSGDTTAVFEKRMAVNDTFGFPRGIPDVHDSVGA